MILVHLKQMQVLSDIYLKLRNLINQINPLYSLPSRTSSFTLTTFVKEVKGKPIKSREEGDENNSLCHSVRNGSQESQAYK